MNILILGDRGQIGSPLRSYLVSKNHSVIGWDKKDGLDYDLSLPENFARLFKDMSVVDKIIFLAFEVGGSKFLENQDSTFSYVDENVALMHQCFLALKITKKPFLFASSQMANMHHTNYGFLKELGERYTRSLNGWICRFWNVYGKESPTDPKSHVITDFIHMAKENNLIEMRTNGSENRQFLYVDDCVLGIESWINGLWDDNSRYYDITSFKWNSIFDVASIISSRTGSKFKLGVKADSIQKGIMNEPDPYILKFWRPVISLENGIEKLL